MGSAVAEASRIGGRVMGVEGGGVGGMVEELVGEALVGCSCFLGGGST